MANLISIARPYAVAAFEYAKAHQCLSAWQTFLEAASLIAKQQEVMLVLDNPELTKHQAQQLFEDILTLNQLDQPQRNFLGLLAEYKRFVALPDIAHLFSAYYAALEKISAVHIVTAITPSGQFYKKIAAALSKQMEREVTLTHQIDPSIIGGAIIHMGDKVIDGSIRGKLSRLLARLTA